MAEMRRRLLVKGTGLMPGQSLAMNLGPSYAVEERIFTSIGAPASAGMAAAATWATVSKPEDGVSTAWDDCHELMQSGLGAAGGAVMFAEPDLPQRWVYGDDRAIGLALTQDCSAVNGQSTDFPQNADKLWWRQAGFSQLGDAAAHAGQPGGGRRVRVAHFDTGFDPGHSSLPAHVNFGQQRNFVASPPTADATDVAPNLLSNPGHGTATLALLAGKAFGSTPAIGGAPEVEVVPIRVANSVVLFYNSAIAQAFDYVHELCSNPATFVDVITMSMGGIASQAWAEAVNALYDEGVFIVTAAGNNYGNLPTRNIVFPARFNRVVAAAGVMADRKPYADLGPGKMAGNYGPPSKMETTIAAFTPNTGWARKGCAEIIDWNGSGTSSATPQVAAAAANWIQKNRAKLDAYPKRWMRVEAVRQALFSAARAGNSTHIGRGELRADSTLSKAPADEAALDEASRDSAYFPLLDVLIGTDLGFASPAGRQMLALEALQLSQSLAVEEVLPDDRIDPSTLTSKNLSDLSEALLAQPGISAALTEALKQRSGTVRTTQKVEPPPASKASQARLDEAKSPHIAPPSQRRLRVFAVDPSLGTEFSTAAINRATLGVRWEELKPGPIGEYIEVVDVDPPSRAAYAPVDLDHPYLLPQDGLTPSEGNPQFHQQMCYAVAMRTVEQFEMALGRSAFWASRLVRDWRSAKEIAGDYKCERAEAEKPLSEDHSEGPEEGGAGSADPAAGGQGMVRLREEYVQRLRIYPHALRMANAFYSPDKKALLLGYFTAKGEQAGKGLPHGVYFAALSHDIIAHETTHALLDGLHKRFSEPTNPDVLAFHEAFADIVALFQHFTLPEALRHQIRQTGGDLTQENLLGQLAVEFGQAMHGGQGALRDAIGKVDENGEWKLSPASDNQYDPGKEAHSLGSVLVSAVFSAFLTIYKERADGLRRLASNGTGVLPPGDIPVGLADRMADEASKVAEQVLRMCIRALDYCPPVDITFGDYLRALITADRDLVPEDPRGYRSAFAAAFRDRGIFPPYVRHLSPDNLVWDPPPFPIPHLENVLDKLDLSWTLDGDREEAFHTSRRNAAIFHCWITDPTQVTDDVLDALGLVRGGGPMDIPAFDGVGPTPGVLGGIEVHSVRPARRIGPNGQTQTDLVVEITQTLRPKSGQATKFRGGCTILIDLNTSQVRYCVTKRLLSPNRVPGQQAFHLRLDHSLRSAYVSEPGIGREPFAVLHRRTEEPDDADPGKEP